MSDVNRPLTERDLEVLNELDGQDRWVWVSPMWVGGTDGSHHSKTLAKLVRRGLAERKGRGGVTRTPWAYQITEAGRAAIKEWKERER